MPALNATFSLSHAIRCAGLVTALVAAAATDGAAQAPSQPPEKPVTSPSQVDVGQLNIVPSAGNAGRSAAPTMIYECKEKPKDCNPPLTTGDKATSPAASPAPVN